MTPASTFYRDIRKLTSMRLVALFGLLVFCLIAVGILSSVINGIAGLGEHGKLLICSALQCVVGFCLPACFASRFCSNNPMRFTGLGVTASAKAYFGVILVFILALPAMNQLVSWNASIHFPEWASGIEATLRSWEDANGKITEKILQTDSMMQLLVVVGVVGILTGFAEEYFFRGTLQSILACSNLRKVAAIWTAAIIFSAMHFQFFGFLPRLLMGVFFGYLFVWTGSLWPAIFAHALNNSLVVVSSASGHVSALADNFGVSQNGTVPWFAILSLCMTIAFFLLFRDYFFKKR